MPEAFLLPEPQASFVANSNLLRDCSAAQPNVSKLIFSGPKPRIFEKKIFFFFDIFVHIVCLNSGWGVRFSVSFFGNYMSRLFDPKTVVFSKAFGRHTRQTGTIPGLRRHACWLKIVPVGQAIFAPEGFLLPDPQASFVANSDLLRDCSAAQPNVNKLIFSGPKPRIFEEKVFSFLTFSSTLPA